MEVVPPSSVCEEHPRAGERGQREERGNESSCAPWQVARIGPASCRMLSAKLRTPGFQVRLAPTLPRMAGAEQSSPTGLQLPCLTSSCRHMGASASKGWVPGAQLALHQLSLSSPHRLRACRGAFVCVQQLVHPQADAALASLNAGAVQILG